MRLPGFESRDVSAKRMAPHRYPSARVRQISMRFMAAWIGSRTKDEHAAAIRCAETMTKVPVGHLMILDRNARLRRAR